MPLLIHALVSLLDQLSSVTRPRLWLILTILMAGPGYSVRTRPITWFCARDLRVATSSASVILQVLFETSILEQKIPKVYKNTSQNQYQTNYWNILILVGKQTAQIKRTRLIKTKHYGDVIMSAMASQITNVSIVYSAVCSGADQRKHQSSTSLAFVRGIHRLTLLGGKRQRYFYVSWNFQQDQGWYVVVLEKLSQ